jgi:hypothetical protein
MMAALLQEEELDFGGDSAMVLLGSGSYGQVWNIYAMLHTPDFSRQPFPDLSNHPTSIASALLPHQ